MFVQVADEQDLPIKGITGCVASNQQPCRQTTKNGLKLLKQMLEVLSYEKNNNQEKIVISDIETKQKAMDYSKCKNENCVYTSPVFLDSMRKFSSLFPDKKNANSNIFNPNLNWDQQNSVNDQDLYDVIQKMCKVYKDEHFHPISFFELLDFDNNLNSTLHNFDFTKKLEQGFRTFCVVINTITSSEVKQCTVGQPCGKHWFALFFDFRPLDDTSTLKECKTAQNRVTKACTLEYFNSSGNPPHPEIEKYMKKTIQKIRTIYPGLNLFYVNSSLSRQQYSKVECGIFVLIYIMKRLEGTPFTWFLYTRLDDNLAYIFRLLLVLMLNM